MYTKFAAVCGLINKVFGGNVTQGELLPAIREWMPGVLRKSAVDKGRGWQGTNDLEQFLMAAPPRLSH